MVNRSKIAKDLWKDPEYRKKQIKSHKGKIPSNLEELIKFIKSPAGRKMASTGRKGKPSPKGMLGKKHSKESKKKMSLIKKGKQPKNSINWRGKNHPSWKGGYGTKRNQAMGRKKYIDWRMSVFTRDNFTCLTCEKVGGYLQAHHLLGWKLYPKLRYELSNGITLCVDCHKLIHKIK